MDCPERCSHCKDRFNEGEELRRIEVTRVRRVRDYFEGYRLVSGPVVLWLCKSCAAHFPRLA